MFIIGKRDTQTGFTKIKFNDEFGNEFEGYIKTESIQSDAWSQLQIIGSILIAINTGILILSTSFLLCSTLYPMDSRPLATFAST